MGAIMKWEKLKLLIKEESIKFATKYCHEMKLIKIELENELCDLSNKTILTVEETAKKNPSKLS